MRYFSGICLSLLFLCHLSAAHPKRKLPINFQLVYGQELLRLDSGQYALDNGSTFRVQTFRFYISGIELFDGEKHQWKAPNSYHLIDVSKPNSLNILFDIPETIHFNKIRFNLGIDSTTNVSGAQGGDLDPSKGMYWAWQSGYINFKLEGTSLSSPNRNNEFQFHLGGYAAPFASIQQITLDVNNASAITIQTDIKKFIGGIDLASQNSIMIPCADAVTLSRLAATIFSIRQ